MRQVTGVISTRQHVVNALAMVVIALCGVWIFVLAGELSTECVDLRETTLEESGGTMYYRVELLVIDLLTSYPESADEEAHSDYLAAFADGTGNVNLCILEVYDSDDICDTIQTCLADDTREIGDCRVSGVFCFYEEEDASLFTAELGEKDAWLSAHQDSLSELDTLFRLSSSARIVDTERVAYWLDSEKSYRRDTGLMVIAVCILGCIVLQIALYIAVIDFVPWLRERKKQKPEQGEMLP